MRLPRILLCILLLAGCRSERSETTFRQYAADVSSLVDPAKLSTLGERGANPRVQKYVARLAQAEMDHFSADTIAVEALRMAGMRNEAARLTAKMMVRNLKIAERLGCLNQAGLEEMRKGRSPTVRKGPYKGQELSVDHIIPVAVAPELDKVIANLELLPLKMNQTKSNRIGDRQLSLAHDLFEAGLLSQEGLNAVRSHRRAEIESDHEMALLADTAGL